MSEIEEILDVFYDDIRQKEKQVLIKSGVYPFVENLDGFQIEHRFGLTEEELELLARISEQEGGS